MLISIESAQIDGIASLRDRPTPPAIPVTTSAVVEGDVPIELEALGRVQAANSVTAHAQVAGQIQKFGFKQGQLRWCYR